MIVTFFRSSSFNAWDMCPFQYMLEWTLGMRSSGNFSADKGSVVHKALELLAGEKLRQQEGRESFTDDELGKTFTATLSPAEAFDISYQHYSSKCPQHAWTNSVYKECLQWMWDAMTYNDGLFNPLKRTIVQPEQYFEFEVQEPWAKYEYTLPNGKLLSGYLGLKGTIDLVCYVNENTIELVDWKTGARKDWSNGDIKDYKKLMKDPQLRMYHYALTRLYPGKRILITIVFIKDGGPYSLPFEFDVEETKQMLRKRFEEIRDCQEPQRVIGTPRERVKTWGHKFTSKCEKFCHFGKTTTEDGETLCDFYHGELNRKGLDQMMVEYGDMEKVGSYGDGGGQSNRDD